MKGKGRRGIGRGGKMAEGENVMGWLVVMEGDAGGQVDVRKRWLDI